MEGGREERAGEKEYHVSLADHALSTELGAVVVEDLVRADHGANDPGQGLRG